MILNFVLMAVSLLIVAYILPGFEVKNFFVALLTALIIGFLNMFLRPLLLFLAFPINLLTLGLFTWIVNAAVLKICAFFTPGFDIRSWWSAIFGALLLSGVNTLLYYLIGRF